MVQGWDGEVQGRSLNPGPGLEPQRIGKTQPGAFSKIQISGSPPTPPSGNIERVFQNLCVVKSLPGVSGDTAAGPGNRSVPGGLRASWRGTALAPRLMLGACTQSSRASAHPLRPRPALTGGGDEPLKPPLGRVEAAARWQRTLARHRKRGIERSNVCKECMGNMNFS